MPLPEHWSHLRQVWRDMKKRCYIKDNKNYKNYGGRGITVCKEWLNDFLTFYNWSMTVGGYAEGREIDRIDNNGIYSLANCKYSTDIEQACNRRNSTAFPGVIWHEVVQKWQVIVEGIFYGYFAEWGEAVVHCKQTRSATAIEREELRANKPKRVAIQVNNTSGSPGVSWVVRRKKWVVRIRCVHYGYFDIKAAAESRAIQVRKSLEYFDAREKRVGKIVLIHDKT